MKHETAKVSVYIDAKTLQEALTLVLKSDRSLQWAMRSAWNRAKGRLKKTLPRR